MCMYMCILISSMECAAEECAANFNGVALEQLREIFTSVSLDKFPRVLQLMQNVESLPKIAKWLNERPATPK